MPSASSSASVPCTVSDAAACPNVCAEPDPPVPVVLRVRHRVDLDEQGRGVGVAVLVRDPKVHLQMGPVRRERVERGLEFVGERHRGQGYFAGSTRIARASWSPSACSRPFARTVSGPPNGWRPTTSSSSPGAMPRSDEVAQHVGVRVGDARRTRPRSPGAQVGERARGLPRRSRRRAWGSGRRAGRASGCRASPRSAPTAPARSRARAPRPPRARGPTARRAARRGRARAAGGGAAPRAPRARPRRVSCTPW